MQAHSKGAANDLLTSQGAQAVVAHQELVREAKQVVNLPESTCITAGCPGSHGAAQEEAATSRQHACEVARQMLLVVAAHSRRVACSLQQHAE